jgi:S-layer homology domain
MKQWKIGIYIGLNLSLVLGLSACKGTDIGNRVEGAIAPKQISEISAKPADPINNPISKSLVLPKDFDLNIPIYPKAVLQSIEENGSSQNISARWTTEDNQALVSSFYEDAFTKQQWRVILKSPDGNFLVQKADIFLILSIQKSPLPANSTSIFLQYLRDRQISSGIDIPNNPVVTPTPNQVPNSTTNFSDIDTVLEALRSLVTDLKKLGSITALSTSGQENQFKPNELIKRRDYAKWLVNTNNRLYSDRPTRQIRLADPSSTPAFVDIPASDRDFAVIQALTNAGLIPTDPSSSKTSRRFRPNDPVSREVLLQWKIPLDLRSAIPSGNLEAVKQAWGFQDSDRIAPTNLKFVLADFKLGDLSNIRRSFGYTTLFQPQKYVTRAEAAAALWYFGTPEDGLSAQNALERITPEPLPPKQPETTDPKALSKPIEPITKPIN